MKPILLLLPFFLGCSTYVKVKDYNDPDFELEAYTNLNIAVSPKNEFGINQKDKLTRLFKEKLAVENPLHLSLDVSPHSKSKKEKEANKKDIKDGILTLGLTRIDCSVSSSIGKNDTRSAKGTCTGVQSVQYQAMSKTTITKTPESHQQIRELEIKTSASSEVSLPAKPGKKSLRPLFSALLDIKTERERAIEDQDSDVQFKARDKLMEEMNTKIAWSILPQSFYVRKKYDDSIDFEGVEDQIKNGNYGGAIALLEGHPESGPKNYNLALMYESLGQFDKLTQMVNYLEANSRKDLHLNFIQEFKARSERRKSFLKQN